MSRSPRKSASPEAAGLRHPQFEPIIIDSRSSFFIRQCSVVNFPFFWHYHRELEIDIYLAGHGLRFVGDSIENFQEGDLCLLGPNLPHSWVTSPAPGQRAGSIYIQFVPECFGPDFFLRPEMQLIGRLFERSRLGLQFRGRIHDEVLPRMLALAHRPIDSWRRADDLLCILGALAEWQDCRPLATGTFSPSGNSQVNDRLGRILTSMNADEHSIPLQREAAREAGLSPQAFSRLFRQCIGKTYARYRNELRVSRACRQLLHTDRPITQIALDAGFDNLSNFNAQFRRIKGITPRAYRHSALHPLPN